MSLEYSSRDVRLDGLRDLEQWERAERGCGWRGYPEFMNERTLVTRGYPTPRSFESMRCTVPYDKIV